MAMSMNELHIETESAAKNTIRRQAEQSFFIETSRYAVITTARKTCVKLVTEYLLSRMGSMAPQVMKVDRRPQTVKTVFNQTLPVYMGVATILR